jgi:hypothetical protein
MLGDRVLDDPKEFLLRGCRADREAMKKLDHETSEALEGTRNADLRINFDEYTLGCVDIDLKLSRLVDRRIE